MSAALSNKLARRIFLDRQGLLQSPQPKQTSSDLLALFEKIGFVQVDSISTVERAHHMILFARNQTYQPSHLAKLLENDASLFEHWTHDASIIPTEFYPYWQHKFVRSREKTLTRWRQHRRDGFEEVFDFVRDHIEINGPTMSRQLLELDKNRPKKQSGGWWNWHPSKTALEFLWHTGELAVSGRVGFQKQYDLAHRVIPTNHHQARVDTQTFIDWACQSAIDRLGIATSGEIAAFWNLISPAEAKTWCDAHRDNGLIEVLVESADGSKPRLAYTTEDVLTAAAELPTPPKRIRTISPFDPVIRDRKRLTRLFNFDYRIEVFVPAAKRKYGYYVFPLLEGDRFIGRIDMKHFRDDGDLRISGIWLEDKMKPSKNRLQKLDSELERLRRFVGAERVNFLNGCYKF